MRCLTTLVLSALAIPALAQESPEATSGEPPPPERGLLAELLGLPGSWDSRGELAMESRASPDDDERLTEDYALGMLGRLELSHDHQPWKERFRAYGRVDAFDDQRSTVVVEEAWVQARKEWLRLRLGLDVVNWTATEAFHPADVVNARNLDSDLENYEKRGEPMAALQLVLPSDTTIELLYMPVYMGPIFTSTASRLSLAPPGTDLGEPLRLERDGRRTESDFGHQGAVRLRQVVGSADLSLHALHHMDRSQPLVIVTPTFEVRPVFQRLTQVGGTYQQVFGGLIAKLEASYRWFHGDLSLFGPLPDRDHGTVAVGLEYGLPHEGGAESTLIAEGQAVLGVEREVAAALTPFQRDALVGYRLALNDEDSKEVLLTAIVDLQRQREFLVSASYQQRLGETWQVRVGARLIESTNDAVPALGLAALKDADLVRLTVVRYF